MLDVWPYFMVTFWYNGLKVVYPSMVAKKCDVLALEVFWFSGSSLMYWWIPNPSILTVREVILRRSSWTHFIPNMDRIKYSLKSQSSGSKVLDGWVVCHYLGVYSPMSK